MYCFRSQRYVTARFHCCKACQLLVRKNQHHTREMLHVCKSRAKIGNRSIAHARSDEILFNKDVLRVYFLDFRATSGYNTCTYQDVSSLEVGLHLSSSFKKFLRWLQQYTLCLLYERHKPLDEKHFCKRWASNRFSLFGNKKRWAE